MFRGWLHSLKDQLARRHLSPVILCERSRWRVGVPNCVYDTHSYERRQSYYYGVAKDKVHVLHTHIGSSMCKFVHMVHYLLILHFTVTLLDYYISHLTPPVEIYIILSTPACADCIWPQFGSSGRDMVLTYMDWRVKVALKPANFLYIVSKIPGNANILALKFL